MSPKLFHAAAAALALGGCSADAPDKAEPARHAHKVVQTISGPDGAYDYLSVDSDAKRLFSAREFGVMALSTETGTVTDRLIEANDVSAVLVLPGTSLMLSTVYGDDKAVIFDRRTGEKKGEIATGKSPDAAAYDPASRLVFVMNAKSNDATVIDPVTMKVLATIPMGGKPEAGVSDQKGRLYVNVEDSAEIAVIDTAGRSVTARYKMAGCEEPTGIAFDPLTATLIAACHNSTVKLIAAADGADRGTVRVGADSDGAIFNPVTRLAYVPSKDGTLSIFQLDDQGKPGPVETVKTAPNARTAALDPATGKVYLASAEFRKDEAGEDVPVPGSFKIVVVAPQ